MKKVQIEKADTGWILTIETDTSRKEVHAYESSNNLMMGIASALSGSASSITLEDKDMMAFKMPRKFL